MHMKLRGNLKNSIPLFFIYFKSQDENNKTFLRKRLQELLTKLYGDGLSWKIDSVLV